MQQADYDNFSNMLGAVSSLYGKKITDEFVIGMWWSALKAYDLAAIRQAFDRHVKNTDSGQFMPKPADLIRMLEGTTQDTALLAWAKVDRALRQVGPYRSVVFDDALIHRCLQEMGGWVELSRKDDDEWPFVAKEFQNRYRSYRSRNEKPAYPAVMVGIAEASNQHNAIAHREPPLLLGDEVAAAVVLHGGTDKPLLQVTSAGALVAPKLAGGGPKQLENA
jgi:hypothetical protein